MKCSPDTQRRKSIQVVVRQLEIQQSPNSLPPPEKIFYSEHRRTRRSSRKPSADDRPAPRCFPLPKSLDKARVWFHTGSFVSHKGERIVVRHAAISDKIGYHNRSAPRYTLLTMNQYTLPRTQTLIYVVAHRIQVALQIRRRRVEDRDTVAVKTVFF